jgi:beta-glucosidase
MIGLLTSPLQFGYGLSYSTFTYANLHLSSTTPSQNDTVTVSVDVTNTSQRDGADVVQVYVKDIVSSVVVPNIRLKGFKKVLVKAGTTQTVQIDLKVADWGLWDANLEYKVEPGQFGIYVGRSSQTFLAQATVTVS